VSCSAEIFSSVSPSFQGKEEKLFSVPLPFTAHGRRKTILGSPFLQREGGQGVRFLVLPEIAAT
jgi:hypothetical protein